MKTLRHIKLNKKTGTFFIILLLPISLCYGQIDTLSPSSPLILEEIQIKKAGDCTLMHDDLTEKMIQCFGEPDTSEPYFYEMMDVEGRLYKYGSNEFYFIENKHYAFDLKTSLFLFGQDGHFIQVGDPINAVTALSPGFVKDNGIVRIPLVYAGNLSVDGFIYLRYDLPDEKITAIGLHFD